MIFPCSEACGSSISLVAATLLIYWKSTLPNCLYDSNKVSCHTSPQKCTHNTMYLWNFSSKIFLFLRLLDRVHHTCQYLNHITICIYIRSQNYLQYPPRVDILAVICSYWWLFNFTACKINVVQTLLMKTIQRYIHTHLPVG